MAHLVWKARVRIGTPNALLCPAPPFDEPVTSAGELRTARQGEDAGRKAPGRLQTPFEQPKLPEVNRLVFEEGSHMDEGAGSVSSAAQREGQLHTDDGVHIDGDGARSAENGTEAGARWP